MYRIAGQPRAQLVFHSTKMCHLKPTFSMFVCWWRTRRTPPCTNCLNLTSPPVLKVSSLRFHTDEIAPLRFWWVSPKGTSHQNIAFVSHRLGFNISVYFCPALGTIYLIGGSVNERLPHAGSRVVSRLNLHSGSLQRVQSLQEAVLRPTVATSSNAIAICGGLSNALLTSSCQIYLACIEK